MVAPASSASLGPVLKAHQAMLRWMIKSPSPIRQEVVNQLLGPVEYPLLRRSLRRLRSTQELDAFLRPVLVPGNHARGFEAWHNNARFQAWVRREFLLRAAEEQQAQRQQKGSFLEPPWQHTSSSSSSSLPTFQQVVDWFGLHDWNRKPGTAGREDQRRVDLFRRIEKEGPDVSRWTLEDLLEVGGACVWGRGGWNVWCEEKDVWELWTQEFVDGLAAYLTRRAEEVRALSPRVQAPEQATTQQQPQQQPVVVLEVGAGTGELAHHLKERLDPKLLHYVATDKEIKPGARPFVEQLAYDRALRRYPTAAIVLCSWMPMGEDWTARFRAQAPLQEYLLIGESGDEACCGSPIETWGAGTPPDRLRPYEADGFTRVDQGELSQWQLSRYDGRAYARNSGTVSFRRRT